MVIAYGLKEGFFRKEEIKARICIW